jgi:hypothetical protein
VHYRTADRQAKLGWNVACADASIDDLLRGC